MKPWATLPQTYDTLLRVCSIQAEFWPSLREIREASCEAGLGPATKILTPDPCNGAFGNLDANNRHNFAPSSDDMSPQDSACNNNNAAAYPTSSCSPSDSGSGSPNNKYRQHGDKCREGSVEGSSACSDQRQSPAPYIFRGKHGCFG